jgi:hypothetical protein
VSIKKGLDNMDLEKSIFGTSGEPKTRSFIKRVPN